jgi:hypothetical protein
VIGLVGHASCAQREEAKKQAPRTASAWPNVNFCLIFFIWLLFMLFILLQNLSE